MNKFFSFDSWTDKFNLKEIIHDVVLFYKALKSYTLKKFFFLFFSLFFFLMSIKFFNLKK